MGVRVTIIVIMDDLLTLDGCQMLHSMAKSLACAALTFNIKIALPRKLLGIFKNRPIRACYVLELDGHKSSILLHGNMLCKQHAT